MPLNDDLKAAASEMASVFQGGVDKLKREMMEVQDQLANKQADLDVAQLVPLRLNSYQDKIGDEYLCPKCWLVEGKQSALRPTGSATDTEDYLICTVCDKQYTAVLNV